MLCVYLIASWMFAYQVLQFGYWCLLKWILEMANMMQEGESPVHARTRCHSHARTECRLDCDMVRVEIWNAPTCNSLLKTLALWVWDIYNWIRLHNMHNQFDFLWHTCQFPFAAISSVCNACSEGNDFDRNNLIWINDVAN